MPLISLQMKSNGPGAIRSAGAGNCRKETFRQATAWVNGRLGRKIAASTKAQ